MFQGHSQLLAAASKHGPNIWFTLQNLDIKFKYIFQVFFIYFALPYFIEHNVHMEYIAHLNFTMIFGKKIIFIFQE